jgi:predicted RNA-binding Zn ribbon-like protein
LVTTNIIWRVTITDQLKTVVTLGLVESFVNSANLEDDVDRLDGQWFEHHGLLESGVGARTRALERARAVREALRVLAVANNGEPADVQGAAAVLDAQARRSRLAVTFQRGFRLEASARGVDAALGTLLARVALAMADGSWSRFKACRSETCRWVFIDRARNRSRQWCSMEICGNRSKARAYRRRRAG